MSILIQELKLIANTAVSSEALKKALEILIKEI
jgi:hypothetical protein